LSKEAPEEAISLKMSIEKTILSPGELFNVFFTIDSHISHSFKRFQHLPKAFKLAQVEEFPRKFKEGDKTLQKVSFVAPSGQVPSDFELFFELVFEKDDTSLLITTVPLLIQILKPEEVPSDQYSITAEHTIDINGNVTTSLQEFPKMEDKHAVLSKEIELVEIETKSEDSDVVEDVITPEPEIIDTLIEEQVETNELLLEHEDEPTKSNEPEDEPTESSELEVEPEEDSTAEISVSEDKTETLTEKISEYTRKIASLENQLQKQTRDLKLKEEDLKNREEEIMQLKNETTRLDDAIGKYRANINDLERTLEELTPRLDELETNYSERGKKINQLEEINANLIVEIDEKNKEMKQQKDEIKRLTKDKSKIEKEITELKTKTEQEISFLKTKTEELELRASEQSAKVIALEETRKELNEQLDEKMEEMIGIKNERDQLQAKQRELKRMITQLSQQIENELQPHIEQLQEALIERDKRINLYKRRISDAENQLNEKDAIIEQQNKEFVILKEQFVIEPEDKILEYYGPTEEPSIISREPEVEDLIDETESVTLSEDLTASSEEVGLVEDSIVSDTEEISREKEIEEYIAKGGEIDTEEIELPIIDETEEIYEEKIEEPEISIPNVPKCEICGSSPCPTCGSSLSFCKVRCTFCKSIMHRHCAEGMRSSESDVFISCPHCKEKVVL
jgi:chromosome segregation ATPase